MKRKCEFINFTAHTKLFLSNATSSRLDFGYGYSLDYRLVHLLLLNGTCDLFPWRLALDLVVRIVIIVTVTAALFLLTFDSKPTVAIKPMR